MSNDALVRDFMEYYAGEYPVRTEKFRSECWRLMARLVASQLSECTTFCTAMQRPTSALSDLRQVEERK